MKAFTLVELMVTVSILLILTITTIPAYLKFNKSQTIESDGRTLVAELNKARAMASNLVYPTGCTSLLGYNVKSVIIGSELTQSGVRVTPLCVPSVSSEPDKKIFTSSFFFSPIDITFSVGNGYLSTGIDTDILIKDVDDQTVTKTITVGVYGSAYLK